MNEGAFIIGQNFDFFPASDGDGHRVVLGDSTAGSVVSVSSTSTKIQLVERI